MTYRQVNNNLVKQCRQQQGFLMIGVVLAIVIISVGMMAVGDMFIKSIKLNTYAKHYTIATSLAERQMEQLKQAIQYPAATYRIIDYPVTTTAVASDPAYVIVTEAKLTDTGQKIVQVTVRVSWTENGNNCSIDFVTYCLRDISIYPSS